MNNKKKVRVYLASQIFAECWREYNERVAKAIEETYPDIELYVPQKNNSINDKTKCASAEDICAGDFTNKKIISLYTDSRECSHTFLDAKNEKLKEFAESQYAYLNLLLVGCLKRYGVMCRTVEEVIAELGKALEAYYE